eukprot:scaffold365_cov361-Pavlova_lutheri.AAC.8
MASLLGRPRSSRESRRSSSRQKPLSFLCHKPQGCKLSSGNVDPVARTGVRPRTRLSLLVLARPGGPLSLLDPTPVHAASCLP